MSKALVIKNADFSANKLDTIEYMDVPCTALVVDKSTASITSILSTETITATPTPLNTTDSITWASSNTHVATVASGVITPVGDGTATITATCGTATATCTVTVAIAKVLAKDYMLNVNVSSGALNDFVTTGGQSGKSLAFGASANTYPAYGRNLHTDSDVMNVYPYPIPSGAKTINVSATGCGIIIVYYNSKNTSTKQSGSKYRNDAKVLDGETPTSGTDWSITSWTYDNRTFNIPDIEGIDSFTIGLYAPTTTLHDDLDVSDITVAFGYDAPAAE